MATEPRFLWWRNAAQDRDSDFHADDSRKHLFPLELQEQSDPIDARPKSNQSTQANWGSPMSVDDSPLTSTPPPLGHGKSLLRESMEPNADSSLDCGVEKSEHENSMSSRDSSKFQEHISEGEADAPLNRKGDKFEPVDVKTTPLVDSGLPPEIWTIVQSAPANFTPQYFLDVSRNLLENPNLTASHLSRAELSYQSFTDASFNPTAQHSHELASIIKHLKPDHQPLLMPGGMLGYKLEWTVVRKLIPRNPKLDDTLLQTCHLFASTEDVVIKEKNTVSDTIKAERYLIVYFPHASDPEKIPFYHPKIRGLAILYTFQSNAPAGTPPGTLSLYYDLFSERPLDNRMTRTALKMLEIIHKHSRGRMAGYQKRVHHDVVIAQKPFQDTYAYLKGKYAKSLMDAWVEQTPAEKHVFEDLGIAAFLIELWTDMYGGKAQQGGNMAKVDNIEGEQAELDLETQRRKKAKSNFRGFVDVGCGNGLLVWILNEEGWKGWGFDARRRKTWSTFDSSYNSKLKEMLLVPEVLQSSTNTEAPTSENTDATATHNGIFPTGTFIVANHADELTIWTPCLAFLSESPFIAIPCCSHNFAGTRFRAPNRPTPNSNTLPPSSVVTPNPPAQPCPQPLSKPKTQSAYASFSAYLSNITAAMNYIPEKEYLRIPSTRNFAVIGREKERRGGLMGNLDDRMDLVREVVEKEMSIGIEEVRRLWVERGDGLMKPGKGSGH